jgi:hypothetical protein
MKKFCVAYTSLYENTTKMSIIEAETEFDALFQVLGLVLEPYEYLTTVEHLKQFAWDCDSIIEDLEL